MTNEENYAAAIEESTQEALEAFEAKKQEEARRKRARRIRRAVIAIIILILLLLLGYYGYEKLRPRSRYEMDMNALEGFLPGKSDEEIQAELNRIIDESRFNVTINTLITYENKEADVRIENVPANHYYMQVDIFLYPDEDSTDNAELFYQSGVIAQGKFIEKAPAKTSVGEGYYNGLAVFHALYPDDTMEEVGSTSMNVVIQVK